MARTKQNGEKVDQVVFIVYEKQASEWAKALSYVGYNNEKRKAKFLWRLVRAGVKYYQEHGEFDELADLKQGAKLAVDKIAASANRTPIKVDQTNSDGQQVDLEEAIEEVNDEPLNWKEEAVIVDPDNDVINCKDCGTQTTWNYYEDNNGLCPNCVDKKTTEQFAADDPLIIPPWLDRNAYKEWKEEELFDKIADLEAKERNTNEEVELKALNRELDSRT